MTHDQITATRDTALARVKLLHDTAASIRQLLDDAERQYGESDEDVEQMILDLVTEEV